MYWSTIITACDKEEVVPQASLLERRGQVTNNIIQVLDHCMVYSSRLKINEVKLLHIYTYLAPLMGSEQCVERNRGREV